MTRKQKRVFLTLAIISLIYFAIFFFPNGTGAKDRSMLSLFEPDEYAQISHLEKMGDEIVQTTRQNHAAYYIQLAQQAEAEFHGANQAQWLARLDAEQSNFVIW